MHMIQASQTQQNTLQLNMDSYSPPYSNAEYYKTMLANSAMVDTPFADGLGITQNGNPQMEFDFGFDQNTMASSQFSRPQTVPSNVANDESNRRTLTQEQFDAFAQTQGSTFLPSNVGDNGSTMMNANGIDMAAVFPELSQFQFPDFGNTENLDSAPMEQNFSNDSYTTSNSGFSDAPSASTYAPTTNAPPKNTSGSDWPVNSAPTSIQLTPSQQISDPFDGANVSPTHPTPQSVSSQTSSAQWQPGTSIPVDFAARAREFQEAKMRSQSVPNFQPPGAGFYEEPLAFPNDDDFAMRRESSGATMLTQQMNHMGMADSRFTSPNGKIVAPSPGSIAARRQRPRPSPLTLRSTSYSAGAGGPPSPSKREPSSGSNMVAGGHSLRRIKSSNTMNGIASGRIMKAGSAQRSPMNLTFADAAKSPGYVRRASAYTSSVPLPTSTSLAPPTPLSPSEFNQAHGQRPFPPWQAPGHSSRQDSMSESDNETFVPASNNGQSGTFSSPPSTPMYPANLMRFRQGMTNENTPPQSAPASQQSFPNACFASSQPTMQQAAPQMQVLQSQPPMMMPVMANNFPQVAPGVGYPVQQMPVTYAEVPMQYVQVPLMAPGQGIQMGFAMPFATNPSMQPQNTPPNVQFPFVPSSSPTNGSHVLVSSQPPKQQVQNDFFIHEYNPPQDVKNQAAPRKTTEGSAPKNYTFVSQNQDHFKGKKEPTSSPRSSNGSVSSHADDVKQMA